MKIKFLAITLLSLCYTAIFAQNHHSVKGTITDTAATYKMVNSTITILNAKDSTLVKFSRSREDGTFGIENLPKGKFILMVTYPGYADYIEDFGLDSLKKTLDFGHLNMTLKATLLAGVIIQGKAAAIKIKGDTTEYNAGSFTIQPNSKVEDLLKQLPGIQVDKDGKITAQGQTVNKVLVDGEEFFGDDPTLVTKNLRGDMVDKVQLYDKKSDQATFTGIDDGEKTKTINIKLKEDKKNGYFGKVNAGIGTKDFYEGQGMFNAFKAKQKFSAYGTFANTGTTGLGWDDSSKYGSSNLQMSDDGGFMFYSGGGDELDSYGGRYNGQGIPATNSGGVHYDSKWNKDKETINANYKIGSIRVEGNRSSLTQNNLPTGVINSASDQDFKNFMFRNKMDATYSLALDSTSNLKVTVDGTLKNSTSEDHFSSMSSRENSLLNQGTRDLSNDADQRTFNASAFYTKKLKKKGRTFSLRASQYYNENKSTGFLKSVNEFYNAEGTQDSVQTIDQFKTNNTSNSSFNSTLTYTEPLTKALSVVLNYSLGISNSTSDRKSFNASSPEQYDNLDLQFSNNFDLDQLSNQGGVTFNYLKGKNNLNIGTRISNVNFKQFDGYANTTYTRDFINWNPQMNYQYKISQQKSLRVSYYGYTSQPSIDQIQPVKVNTDPLNIRLGNPDLKPSFNSSIYMYYNSYKVLSDQWISMSGSVRFTNNTISNNTITDTAGKSTSQSINLGKIPVNYSFSLYSSQKIKPLDMTIGFDMGVDDGTRYNMVNNEVNKTTSNSYRGNLSLRKYKEKKYSADISGGPNYNTSQSSLQKQNNNNGWGFNGRAGFNIYLPGKIEIGTDGNYEYRGKTQTFNQTFERFLWNASITKKFFKSENLKLAVAGNDLLNQNTGFDRNAYSNMITQNSYTTIKRYFMCSLTWDFNKMGGSTPQK